MRKLLNLSMIAALFLGCAHGNCRSQRPPHEAGKEVKMEPNSLSKVKVYKPDGSLQCGMGKGISLSEMAKELEGFKIYSSENKNDGMMRIQVCGSPTGQCNVYEIEKSQLEKALSKGFREWTFD